MTRPLNRRTLLVGGGVAVLAVIAGGATATRMLAVGRRSPDADAEDYVKLLAEVRDDYINGRVVEREGWIMSQHEFDTIGIRESRAAAASSTTAS